jgi:hypothetical protein
VTLTRKTVLPLTAAAILLLPLSTDAPSAFYDLESALRLQVTPRETEVFVDGYFAGRVDDFDGRFQRLRIQPGEHELTLYLEGHRKITQQVLIRHVGVDIGGGYRISGATDALDDRLNGATGSMAVQLTW